MSEVKHTPGPWSVQLVVKEDTGWKAMVHVGECKNYGNPICKVFMGGHGALFSAKEDVEANAKLISVAPDMYEIVKELYDWAQATQRFGPIYPKIEAVIKKITT